MPDFDPRGLPFLNRSMLDVTAGTAFTLDLRVVTTAQVKINITGITKNNVFKFQAQPNGNGVAELFSFPLLDIPVNVTASFDPQDGNPTTAYITMTLSVNGVPTIPLGNGFMTQIIPVTWPIPSSFNTPQISGFYDNIGLPNPDAGANFVTTVPTGEAWEITAIQFQLATSAAAANRTPVLLINGGAPAPLARTSGTAIVASKTVNINCVPGGTNQVITADALHEIGLPLNIVAFPGWTIETVITNLQAGDQVGNFNIWFRRVFQPAY